MEEIEKQRVSTAAINRVCRRKWISPSPVATLSVCRSIDALSKKGDVVRNIMRTLSSVILVLLWCFSSAQAARDVTIDIGDIKFPGGDSMYMSVHQSGRHKRAMLGMIDKHSIQHVSVHSLSAEKLIEIRNLLDETIAELGLPASRGAPPPRASLPALGASYQTLTKENAQKHGLPSAAGGAFILEVEPGSVAEQNCLWPGDLIVEANGELVRSAEGLEKVLSQEGLEEVEIETWRGMRSRKFSYKAPEIIRKP